MDAHNAFSRIQEVFEAESLTDERVKDSGLENGLELDNASFTWDVLPPEPDGGKGKEVRDPKEDKNNKKPEVSTSVAISLTPSSVPGSSRVSTPHEPEQTEKVFKFQMTNLRIPKGQVVAIVGPVGSGKSSLLQGLIGEMRKETGSVRFGGSVSYCPQNAWVQVPANLYCGVSSPLLNESQNATVRENICFGQPFDSDRYWQAVSDSCLDADLRLFPNGDLTEVGERGISLSGGQKQRVNICRAIYYGADVQIFDASNSLVRSLQTTDRKPSGSAFRPGCPCREDRVSTGFRE